MASDRSTEEAAEGGDAGVEMSTQPELLAVLRLDCRRELSTDIRCIALQNSGGGRKTANVSIGFAKKYENGTETQF